MTAYRMNRWTIEACLKAQNYMHETDVQIDSFHEFGDCTFVNIISTQSHPDHGLETVEYRVLQIKHESGGPRVTNGLIAKYEERKIA